MRKKQKRIREPKKWRGIPLKSQNFRLMNLASQDFHAGKITEAEYARVVDLFNKGPPFV